MLQGSIQFIHNQCINFRSKCRKTNNTEQELTVEELYLDLEDLKQSKSSDGREKKSPAHGTQLS